MKLVGYHPHFFKKIKNGFRLSPTLVSIRLQPLMKAIWFRCTGDGWIFCSQSVRSLEIILTAEVITLIGRKSYSVNAPWVLGSTKPLKS